MAKDGDGLGEGDIEIFVVTDTHAVLYNSAQRADVAVVVWYWPHCERLFWPAAN